MIAIGALRQRMVLEEPVETADGAGGVTRSWSAVATIWAALEPLSAGRGLVAGARASIATHRIVLRWRPDLTAAKRLTLGARVFVPTAVQDPDGKRTLLVVLAEEIAA